MLIFLIQITVITVLSVLVLKIMKLNPESKQRIISICFIMCLIIPILQALSFTFSISQHLRYLIPNTEVPSYEWTHNIEKKLTATPPRITQTDKLKKAQSLTKNHKNYWPNELLILWLAGVLLTIGILLVRLLHIKKIIDESTPVCHDSYLILKNLNTHKKVQIINSDNAETPFLFVLNQVYIVFPAASKNWSQQKFEHVIQHEICHYNRKDHWTIWLSLITSTIYWFNPIIRYLCIQQKNTIEEACDQELVACGIDPYAYAETLVFVARDGVTNQMLIEMSAKPNLLKQRVQAILLENKGAKKHLHKKWLILMVLTCILIGCVDFRSKEAEIKNVVKLISHDLPSFKNTKIEQDQFYLSAFYDGQDNQNTFIALEIMDSQGATAWLKLGSIKKFNNQIYTWHFQLLNGAQLTNRYQISGAQSDGMVDGVAIGLLMSDAQGRTIRKQTVTAFVGSIPNAICSWPLDIHEDILIAALPQLSAHPTDSMKLLLCGAQLFKDGQYNFES